MVGSVAGIASFVLAVVQANLPSLADVQRWGLHLAFAGLIWLFFLSTHARLVRHFTEYATWGRTGLVLALSVVVAPLQLFVVPFMAFGLDSSVTEGTATWFAVSYFAVGLFWTVGTVISYMSDRHTVTGSS